MLRDLRIQNFALIDDLQVQFQPGLNILTGETGAGKSIIIDALGMLLGGRASADFIRTGYEKAKIETVFDIKGNQAVKDFLTEIGFEYDEEELLLSRDITETGNNRLRINGQFATRNIVSDLSQYLLDIHGQNGHQTLMHRDQHLELLDEYGQVQIGEPKAKVQKIFKELRQIKKELDQLKQNEQEKNQRIDLLRFQIEEIDQAKLRLEEEEELNTRRKILLNAEKLFKSASEINDLLNGDGYEMPGAMDLVGKIKKNLEGVSQIDPTLAPILQMVESAYYQLEEASFEMGSYSDGIEFDQDELAKIEERLALLSRLKRKYGQEVAEILKHRQRIGEELLSLENSEERIEELEKKLTAISHEYVKAAQELTEARKEVGLEFAWKVMRQMNELSMPNAKFVVQVEWQEKAGGIEIDGIEYNYGKDGLDQVEFMISPNPGEPLKPLIKIASGGEISRIMLAIKAVTTNLDQVPSVIFDEIDSGVGGEAGQRVAEKLALIAKGKQVICITHLPQIAAMADAHYHIYKEIKDNRTHSYVVHLERDQQIAELARMYGGTEVQAARKHAAEMLKLAQKKKEEL